MNAVLSRDGDTASQILWLVLSREDDEAEEALYELNPGLEQYGPVLPAGINIKLPDLEDPAPAELVNVWD